MEEKSVKQILAEIHEQLKPISELSVSIVMQAELQSYSENLYNQLVQLAYEGIGFLEEFKAGDVVSEEWIAKRDDIVARAQRLILDAPNAKQ